MPENIGNDEYIDGSSRIEINENGETTPVNPITTAQSVQVKIGSTDTDLQTIINNDIYASYGVSDLNNAAAVSGTIEKNLVDMNAPHYINDNGEWVYGLNFIARATSNAISDVSHNIETLKADIEKQKENIQSSSSSNILSDKVLFSKDIFTDIVIGEKEIDNKTNYMSKSKIYDVRFDINSKSVVSELLLKHRPIRAHFYMAPFGIEYSSDIIQDSDINGAFFRCEIKYESTSRYWLASSLKTTDGNNVIVYNPWPHFYDIMRDVTYSDGTIIPIYMEKCNIYNDTFYIGKLELSGGKVVYIDKISPDQTKSSTHYLEPHDGRSEVPDIGKLLSDMTCCPIFIQQYDSAYSHMVTGSIKPESLIEWYDSVKSNNGMSSDLYDNFIKLYNDHYQNYNNNVIYNYRYIKIGVTAGIFDTDRRFKLQLCLPKFMIRGGYNINISNGGVPNIFLDVYGAIIPINKKTSSLRDDDIETPYGLYNVIDTDYIYMNREAADNASIVHVDVYICFDNHIVDSNYYSSKFPTYYVLSKNRPIYLQYNESGDNSVAPAEDHL